MIRKSTTADWTDAFIGVNAGSTLPTDDFTPSNGTSFGLDSFNFDETDGAGIADSARLPETRGLSRLPDGFTSTAASEPDPDLTDPLDGIILGTGDIGLDVDANVIDLDWLDPTQPQDPERLPDNEETLHAIPQLEEAWAERTDGVSLMPNTNDLTVQRYQDSVRDGGDEEHSGLPGVRNAAEEEAVKEAVLRGVRRAHFGMPMAGIKEDLVAALGHGASRTKKIVATLESEYGLLGNVFIRASAFPGLRNGQWVKEIKRGCRTAHYVITDDSSIAIKLGMKQVSEVPWKAALAYYQPMLAASGYKVASGDPRDALRQAFLKGPKIATPKESNLPVEETVVASDEEAKAALKAPRAAQEAPKTAEAVAVAKKHRAALLQVAKWVEGGYLAQDDAIRLHTARLEPHALLKMATDLMTATRNAPVYAGVGTSLSEDARVARQAVLDTLETKQAALEAGQQEKIKASLLKSVKAGLLTVKEAQQIAKMGKSAAETEKVIAAAVLAAQEKRTASMTAVVAAPYKGTAQQPLVQLRSADGPALSESQQQIMKAAAASGIAAGEFNGLLRYARQKMTEGVVGNDLEGMLVAKFSMPLLKAAKDLLKDARAQHEGLSGHLYVDAAAYATPSGAAGCEKAASKHRTNSVKAVLAMPRCDTCVHKNANNHCTLYGKPLITLASDPTALAALKSTQAEMIRLANEGDAARTIAMYDPDEFELHNASLDEVSPELDIPQEKLGEMVFGGMELGE